MNVQSGLDGATVVCPKPGCATASPAGTRFCPACGTPLAADGGRVPPPPPPPPRPDLFGQAGMFASSGGLSRRFEVARPATEVRDRLTAFLSRGGYEAMEPTVAGSIRALHRYKHWTTAGMGLRYVLDFRVSDAGSERSVVDLHIDLEQGVLMRYLLTSIACILVLGVLSGGLILIVGLIGLPIDYQNVTKKIPGKLADKTAGEIGAESKSFGASGTTAAKPSWAPPPLAASPSPAPVAAARRDEDRWPEDRWPVGSPAPSPMPANVVAGHAIMEQIGMLAGLRDKGAITEADFETKKAELLARL